MGWTSKPGEEEDGGNHRENGHDDNGTHRSDAGEAQRRQFGNVAKSQQYETSDEKERNRKEEPAVGAS